MITIAILGMVILISGPLYGMLGIEIVVGVVEKVTPSAEFVDDGGKVGDGSAARPPRSNEVSIKALDGNNLTFASEDKGWVTRKGKCVKVKAFPHAPWLFDNNTTHLRGELLQTVDSCGRLT